MSNWFPYHIELIYKHNTFKLSHSRSTNRGENSEILKHHQETHWMKRSVDQLNITRQMINRASWMKHNKRQLITMLNYSNTFYTYFLYFFFASKRITKKKILNYRRAKKMKFTTKWVSCLRVCICEFSKHDALQWVQKWTGERSKSIMSEGWWW